MTPEQMTIELLKMQRNIAMDQALNAAVMAQQQSDRADALQKKLDVFEPREGAEK
jgi:hypothetical protein